MTNTSQIILIYILCLSWLKSICVFSESPCKLEVTNLHNERKLECLEYKNACRADANEQTVPDNLHKSVEKPATLFAKSYLKEWMDEGWYATMVDITWTPPQSATALKNLKGFLLRISTLVPKPHTYCRTFMIKDGLMPYDKGALFKHTVGPVEESATYFIVIWSLPRSGEQFEMAQTIQVTTPSTLDYDHDPFSSAIWTPYILFRVVGNDEVQVTFDFGNFSIEEFSVKLITKEQEDSGDYTYDKTVLKSKSRDPAHGKVSFKDLEGGTYLIQVTPLDSFKFDPQRCLCFMIEDGDRTCGTCVTSQTTGFNVPGKGGKTTLTPGGNTTPTPGGKDKGDIATGGKDTGGKDKGDIATGGKDTDDIATGGKDTGGKDKGGKDTGGKDKGGKDTGGKDKGGKDKGDIATGGKDTAGGKDKGDIATGGKDKGGKDTGGKGTGKNSEKMVVIVSALFVCVIVFGSLSTIIWKAYHKRDNHRIDQPAAIVMDTFSQDSADNRKSILVLSADDHYRHLEVVKDLLNILNQYCGFNVIYPPNHINQICQINWKNWIVQCVNNVDFVLLITSEAAAKLLQASLKRETYNIPQLTETGHLFVPMVRQVLKASSKELTFDKYITVSFSYTPRELATIPGLPTPHNFTLVEGLREFLCFLKNVSGASVTATMSDENNFTNLEYSVLRAARYESSNVHWFSERFGDPYQRGYNRLDSGYHSIAPPRTNNISESSCPENQLEKEDERDELGFYPPEEEVKHVVFYNIPPDAYNADHMSLSVSTQLRKINDNSAY